MRATIYAELGNFRRACDEWSQLTRTSPDYVPARDNLELLYDELLYRALARSFHAVWCFVRTPSRSAIRPKCKATGVPPQSTREPQARFCRSPREGR